MFQGFGLHSLHQQHMTQIGFTSGVVINPLGLHPANEDSVPRQEGSAGCSELRQKVPQRLPEGDQEQGRRGWQLAMSSL